MSPSSPTWRHCSRCKSAIACGAKYLVCSVSTCNRKRSAMVFCRMDCWDAHVPIAGHRVAHAEELVAPKTPGEEAAKSPAEEEAKTPARTGRRRIAPVKRRDPSLTRDPLIVTKALKAYVAAVSGLRTSDAVTEVLSDKLRDMCDRAIDRAKNDGRKTLLDRDFLPK